MAHEAPAVMNIAVSIFRPQSIDPHSTFPTKQNENLHILVRRRRLTLDCANSYLVLIDDRSLPCRHLQKLRAAFRQRSHAVIVRYFSALNGRSLATSASKIAFYGQCCAMLERSYLEIDRMTHLH